MKKKKHKSNKYQANQFLTPIRKFKNPKIDKQKQYLKYTRKQKTTVALTTKKVMQKKFGRGKTRKAILERNSKE